MRRFPLSFRHAPLSLNGLNLPDLYIEQGIAQLRQVITHGAISSITGKLFRVSLELAQLEIGSGQPLFSTPFHIYGCLLTHCWIKSLWEFVSTHKIVLEWPDQVLPKQQRQGDEFIMDHLLALDSFDQATLISCNRCRLTLQAVTWADIVTGDGRRIRSAAWQVRPDLLEPSSWEFPREQPGSRDVTRWRAVLQQLFPHLVLPLMSRLGSWIQTPHKKWQWFFDPRTQHLFRYVNGHWHHYVPVSTRMLRRMAFQCTGTTSAPPIDLLVTIHRATASFDHRLRACFEGSADIMDTPPSGNISFPRFLQSWESRGIVTTNIRSPIYPHLLVASIINGTAQGCTDGSYMPQQSESLGSAAWIVECPDTHEQLSGWVQTTGSPVEVDSYRSELQGLHELLVVLAAFCEFHSISTGAIMIGCNNLTAIRRAGGTWEKLSQSIKHVDLIRAIRLTASSLPICVRFQHVYGHQDDLLPTRTLSPLAQLNVRMAH